MQVALCALIPVVVIIGAVYLYLKGSSRGNLFKANVRPTKNVLSSHKKIGSFPVLAKLVEKKPIKKHHRSSSKLSEKWSKSGVIGSQADTDALHHHVEVSSNKDSLLVTPASLYSFPHTKNAAVANLDAGTG